NIPPSAFFVSQPTYFRTASYWAGVTPSHSNIMRTAIEFSPCRSMPQHRDVTSTTWAARVRLHRASPFRDACLTRRLHAGNDVRRGGRLGEAPAQPGRPKFLMKFGERPFNVLVRTCLSRPR